MSSLRKGKQTKNIIFKPSPTNKRDFVMNLLSQLNKSLYTAVKEISRSISLKRQKYISGSMTVEAAILIPLILFFFLYLSGIIEMLRQHGKVTAKLWNLGNQIAVYGAAFIDTVEGADFLQSVCTIENDCVDIMVTYRIDPPVRIFPFGYRRMSNRYYARCWTGYDVSANLNSPEYVYITPDGEVWHKTKECSYIYHKVVAVSTNKIEGMKNNYGEKYELCELCEDSPEMEEIYITQTGEKYHRIDRCSAIYREIQAVEWHEDFPYRACSRCAREK